MKCMVTKSELIERLKDAKAVEIIASQKYERDKNLFFDDKIKKTLQKIEVDEDRHIAMLTGLISFLEK